MDKILNYIIFLCFFYLLTCSFKKNRSVFSPSNFFILGWFINYTALLFFVRDYKLHFEGSGFILLMCTLVYFFGNIGLDQKINYFEKKKIKLINAIPNLKYFGLIASILGLLVYPLMIIDVNGDLTRAFDISYIKKVGTVLSYMRYKFGYSFPIYIQFLLGLNYFACLVSGSYFAYLYINKRYKFSVLYLLCLFTSVSIALITTEKAVIIFSVVLFISSFFVSYHAISNMEFKLSRRSMLLFLCSSCLVLVLFIYIQMNRYGFSDIDGLRYVLRKFKVYAFGHISAFSIWFKYHAGCYHLGFGRYTFAGLYSLLNVSERAPGIYSDYAKVSNVPNYSNVFTAFRGLITDFSIVGTSVLLSFIVYLSAISYKYVNKSIFFYLYLVGFYCFTLLSFLSSMMNYNTIIFAFGLFFIILVVLNTFVSLSKSN